jgi:predicted phage-related endonuclease
VFEGNEATKWGEENEPVALNVYAGATGLNVQQVGFVQHPTIAWIGGSPDGLTDHRLVEIKCPFGQKVYEEVPSHYMAQVQGLLEVTEKPWADLAVWTPTKMRVFTIERSEKYWEWMYPRLAEFWAYVQAGVEPPRATKSAFDYGQLVHNVSDFEIRLPL